MAFMGSEGIHLLKTLGIHQQGNPFSCSQFSLFMLFFDCLQAAAHKGFFRERFQLKNFALSAHSSFPPGLQSSVRIFPDDDGCTNAIFVPWAPCLGWLSMSRIPAVSRTSISFSTESVS